MKSTGVLAVLGDYSVGPEIVKIHPNAGFDLGLMTTEYNVAIASTLEAHSYGVSGGQNQNKSGHLPGKILLLNDCPHGKVVLNFYMWKKMGKPNGVTLNLNNDVLFIHPVNK